VLTALVSIEQDQGDFAKALRYARELVALNPADARLHSLVSDLEKKAVR
jgi:Flp pilus assembly protein TadD